MLAQLDDVTVFQTAAFAEAVDSEVLIRNAMLKTGQASYGALNLGLHVNDNAIKVLNNRMSLMAAINEQLIDQQRLPINSLHWINQVHGKQVHDIDASSLSMRPVAADALVSEQPQLGLAIMTADCVPIVLYQPASGKIAAIHAGWQGLACGVIQATAERFTINAPIMAWIGICISQPNYEVDYQVRDKLLAGCIENKLLSAEHLDNFAALFSISANSVSDSKAVSTDVDTICSADATDSNDKIKLDLPKLAKYQLEALDIRVSNDSAIDCSYANTNYYSYRRQTHLQQPATGRMALIIVRSLAI